MNRVKKTISTLLLLCMALNSMSINASGAESGYASREYVISEFVQSVGRNNFSKYGDLSQYTDSDEISEDCKTDLALAVGSDILKGYEDNTLKPEENIKRVEALAILSRCLPNLNTNESEMVFEDTPEWAASDISRLTRAGLLKGYGDGTFGADDYLTKEQVAMLTDRVDGMFSTAAPQEDFYEYVNAKTIRNHSAYPGSDRWTTMSELAYETEQLLKNEVETMAENVNNYSDKSAEGRIANTYLLANDYNKRNKDGVEPLREYLDMVDSAENIDEYIEAVCYIYMNTGSKSILSFGTEIDYFETGKYSLYLYPTDFGMTKEKWGDKEKASTVKAYKNYVKTIFDELGYDNSSEVTEEMCKWQQEMANHYWDEDVTVNEVYNQYSISQLQKILSNVDIKSVMTELGLSEAKNVIVICPKVMSDVNKTLTDDNLLLLKNFTKYCLVNTFSGCLNEKLINAGEAYYKTLSDLESYDKSDLANALTRSIWANDMGRIYVEKYFDESSVKDVENMTKQIITVFEKRIKDADWMSDTTKKNAIKKLDNMKVNIGHEDFGPTYLDEYEVTPASEGGTLAKIEMDILSLYAELDGLYIDYSVNKDGWSMYPHEVNAAYSPTDNAITIPAAILQPPYYDKNRDDVENWGGIGTIIAHEITHAFDTDGSYYDSKGEVKDWWTVKDRANFDKLAEDVKKYYSGVEVDKGLFVDGEATVGENIADLGSVSCVLEIVKEKNYDLKEFFEAYARNWATNMSKATLKYYIEEDVHSPGMVRVNAVLSNFEEFLETYDIKEGDDMYLAPEDRVKVW